MFRRWLLMAGSLVLVVGCGPDDGLLDEVVNATYQPIINGKAANAIQFRPVGAFVVNTSLGYQSFCSGTVINRNTVLTAAHCLDDFKPGDPIGFFLGQKVGASGTSSNIIPVKTFWLHPKYKKTAKPPGTLTDFYDIALARLSSFAPAIVFKLIRPSELGAIVVGAKTEIVGFGQTKAGDKWSSGTKHYGTSAVRYVAHSEMMLTTGSARKCHGDSGGPTFIDVDKSSKKLLKIGGVASRGAEGCTVGTIETRVDPFLSWIHSKATLPCESGLSKSCTPTPKGLGGACTKNSDCKSNLCLSKVCSQTCDVTKDDCPNGYYCKEPTGSQKAVCVKGIKPPPKKEMGEACRSNGECKTNLCVDGICTQVCQVAKGNCPAGYYCKGQTGNGVCVKGTKPPPPPPKKDSGQACTAHADCKSGICVNANGQKLCTIYCTGDQSCWKGTICVQAGGDKQVCIPGKRDDPQPASSSGCAVGGGSGGGLLVSLALLLLWRRRRTHG